MFFLPPVRGQGVREHGSANGFVQQKTLLALYMNSKLTISHKYASGLFSLMPFCIMLALWFYFDSCFFCVLLIPKQLFLRRSVFLLSLIVEYTLIVGSFFTLYNSRHYWATEIQKFN